ncbi:hypothetical protein SAMN06298212_13628 [Ruaniaceae bacterium KH17]|nr:hypothetical protein SAMN06298212_13628 [Ruaniaceae bacterium KH17]
MMLAFPTHIALILPLAVLASAEGDYDATFGDADVQVAGNWSELSGGAAGSSWVRPGESWSPGSSGGVGSVPVSDVPVFLCDQVSTLGIQGVSLSYCVPPGARGSFNLMADDMPMFAADPDPDDPDAPAPAAVPIVVSASDLQSLPIMSGELQLQPSGGRALINADVIGYSTAATHTLATSVLGVPVQVRVTPVQWWWSFTDSDTEPFATTVPGGPYPDMTVTGVYSRTGEGRTASVTITWMGEYRVGAGPWFGSAEGLVESGVYAASVAASFIMVSNSMGVSFPSRRCRRLRW